MLRIPRLEVAEDKAVAATWFEKAAREGHAQAMKNLAKMYAAGDGVPEDPEKAPGTFRVERAFSPGPRKRDPEKLRRAFSAFFFFSSWGPALASSAAKCRDCLAPQADYWFKKAGMGELYVKGKRARNF